MEERPERAVGIAVVIFLDVLRLEVDRRGGEAIGARHGQLAGEMLDLLARPAEPDAAMLAQCAVHREREPALRAGRPAALVDRYAVRDDDQPAHRTVFQPRHPTPATSETVRVRKAVVRTSRSRWVHVP